MARCPNQSIVETLHQLSPHLFSSEFPQTPTNIILTINIKMSGQNEHYILYQPPFPSPFAFTNPPINPSTHKSPMFFHHSFSRLFSENSSAADHTLSQTLLPQQEHRCCLLFITYKLCCY